MKICIEDNPNKIVNGWIETSEDLTTILWLRKAGMGNLYRYVPTKDQALMDVELVLSSNDLDELLKWPIKPLSTSLCVQQSEWEMWLSVQRLGISLWSQLEAVEINEAVDTQGILNEARAVMRL